MPRNPTGPVAMSATERSRLQRQRELVRRVTLAAAIAALRRIAEADPPMPAAEAQREARAAVARTHA